MNNSRCSTNENIGCNVECNQKRFDSRMSQGDMRELNQSDVRNVNNRSKNKEEIRPNSDY